MKTRPAQMSPLHPHIHGEGLRKPGPHKCHIYTHTVIVTYTRKACENQTRTNVTSTHTVIVTYTRKACENQACTTVRSTHTYTYTYTYTHTVIVIYMRKASETPESHICHIYICTEL